MHEKVPEWLAALFRPAEDALVFSLSIDCLVKTLDFALLEYASDDEISCHVEGIVLFVAHLETIHTLLLGLP
jgi:hypothetical protein